MEDEASSIEDEGAGEDETVIGPLASIAVLTVLRFWWAKDSKTLPDEESLRAARSWSVHRQIVYTNVPERVWREAGLDDADYEVVQYEPPHSSRGYTISPQCFKDLWQFQMTGACRRYYYTLT